MSNTNNISLNFVNKVLKNLLMHYKVTKQTYDNLYGGGRDGDKNYKKHYKKYKRLVKNSTNTINYYKTVAETNYANLIRLSSYYRNLVGILRSQRDGLLGNYNKLSNDYKSNTDKINMLETMITGFEKFMDVGSKIDLKVKSTIGDKELRYDFGATPGTKTFKLSGGAMDYSDFERKLMSDIKGLQIYAEGLDKDKTFIENKIQNLHARMSNIINNNNKLFEINASIEWMINKLEKASAGETPVEQQDFEELYKKLQTHIQDVMAKGQVTENIAKYIKELESFAEYIFHFIESTNKTRDGLDSSALSALKSDITKRLESIVNATRDVNRKPMIGGNLEETYNDINDKMKTNIVTILNSIPFTNIDVFKDDIKTTIEYALQHDQEMYGKLVILVRLLQKLDAAYDDYYSALNYFGDDKAHKYIEHNEEQNNLKETWLEVFKTRITNTDFYKKILEKPIYFYNSIDTGYKALTNLKNTSPKGKIMVPNSHEKLNLETIDNTIVFLDHLTYFLYTIINGHNVLYGVNNPDLESYINIKYDNFIKSNMMDPYEDFQKVYMGEMIGGETKHIQLKGSMDTSVLEENHMLFFREFFNSYVKLLGKSAAKIELTTVNLELMDKLKKTSSIITNLSDKIAIKLSKPVGEASGALGGPKLETFSDFYGYIKTVKPPMGAKIVKPIEDIIKSGGSYKPRLDIFKQRLENCYEELKPYKATIEILLDLLNLKKLGQFGADETRSLISIYSEIKTQIDLGINSYIKVIPMVFFTVEFPPQFYKDTPCKFQLGFKSLEEIMTYNYKDGDKEVCRQYDIEPDDIKPIEFNSHAAFLESNKQNGTLKLINDNVIGLKKLIESDSTPDGPQNKVINMMFAIGASGTGKTTRYFGRADAPNPDDRTGIVTSIITEAIEKDPNTKVSFAYFVCYGRKESLANDSGFEDMALFFNVNNIFNNDTNENKNYLPFFIDTVPSVANTNYLDFYINLMKNKLSTTTFNNVKDYVLDGGKKQGVPDKLDMNFRQLLESNVYPIWKTINSDEIGNLQSYFDRLLQEQKKIRTVLPTVNNIESSRGHTCVLIRIEDKTQNKLNTRYFPLFDMAGTEKPEKVTGFFKTGKDIPKMAKLIKLVNQITTEDEILDNVDDKTTQQKSLFQLFKDKRISSYVKKDMAGGGKKATQSFVMELLDGRPLEATDSSEKFINKIIKEGYYINHTIATLIFASMCIGKSINTIKQGNTDQFSLFGDELFAEIKKYTCEFNKDCDNKTMFLLDNMNFDTIINMKSIWLHILFSFLYWNIETPESFEYLCAQENMSYNVISDIMDYNHPDRTILKESDTTITYGNIIKLYPILESPVEDTIDSLDLLKEPIVELNKKTNRELEPVSKIYLDEIDNNLTFDANTDVDVMDKMTLRLLDVDGIPTSTLNIKKYYEAIGRAKGKSGTHVYPKKEQDQLTSRSILQLIDILYPTSKGQNRTAFANFIDDSANVWLKMFPGIKLTDNVVVDSFAINGEKRDYTILKPDGSSTSRYMNRYMAVSEIADRLFGKEGVFPATDAIKKLLRPFFEVPLPELTSAIIASNAELDKYSSKYNGKEVFRYFLIVINLFQYVASRYNEYLRKIDSFKNIIESAKLTIKDNRFDVSKKLLIKLREAGIDAYYHYSDTQFYLSIKSGDNISTYKIKELYDVIHKIFRNDTVADIKQLLTFLDTIKDHVLEENQIVRVQDGRISAAKMTLMHLVTGEGFKHSMVKETIRLAQSLYDSTNIDLSSA